MKHPVTRSRSDQKTLGPAGPRRKAIAIPIVLLLVSVGLVIALGVYNYSRESYRRAARGAYGTMSEVLAESAAEECWFIVQRDANNPSAVTRINGETLYNLFRGSVNFEGPLPLPLLSSQYKKKELDGYLAERYQDTSFSSTVKVQFENPYKPGIVPNVGTDGVVDALAPHERIGRLTITGIATPTARHEGLTNYRKVVIHRAFRTVKITPPMPFDRSGLIIVYPEYMTNTNVVAGLLDDAGTLFQTALTGSKSDLENSLLGPINEVITRTRDQVNAFMEAYKRATSPPFGGHLVPPPKWLQNIIDKLGGVVSKRTQIDLVGQNGVKPFLPTDAVFVARNTIPGGKLGDLDDFNYEKKMRDKLGPIKGIAEKIQVLIDIDTQVIRFLAPIHQVIPYGASLEALRAAATIACLTCGQAVYQVCSDAHEKVLDPILSIANGVGQALALIQKIVLEIPTMGQQAFAGFIGQIQNLATGVIGQKIPSQLNLDSAALLGLPVENPAVALAYAMPLPNYTLGSDFKTVSRTSNFAATAGAAGEKFLTELLNYAKGQAIRFIQQKVAELLVEVPVLSAKVSAACASTVGVGCAAAQAAATVVITTITKVVQQELDKQLNQIGTMKGESVASLVGGLIEQLPFLQRNEILQELKLGQLCTQLINAAINKQDPTQVVEQWLLQLEAAFVARLQEATNKEIDRYGGVLKGYVLRHRFRNLVEFTPAVVGRTQGLNKEAASGASALDAWRSAFDRVYKERYWKAKATWTLSSQKDWDGLVFRYFDGLYKKELDSSGQGSSPGVWEETSSYKQNIDYGLNGVVFYGGTEDLKIAFPTASGKKFVGKLILYAPNASIVVERCVMNKADQDTLTVISGKDVSLPSGEVQISIHAVGNDSRVHLSGDTKLFGSIVLKRYRTSDQTDNGGKNALCGDLTYNERLNGAGSGPTGVKTSHLFVTLSPYVLSKEVRLTP